MRRYIPWTLAASLLMSLPVQAQNLYVGAKRCAACHGPGAPGNVFHAWETSRHAQAFRNLQTHSEKEARNLGDLRLWIVEIGRGVKYGLPKPAAESKECLPCHVSAFGVDARQIAPSFDPKDGVQCESCHGPGSAHAEAMAGKNAGSAAAGLKRYENEGAIKGLCRSCHEGTCGDFDFAAMWPAIRHSATSPGSLDPKEERR